MPATWDPLFEGAFRRKAPPFLPNLAGNRREIRESLLIIWHFCRPCPAPCPAGSGRPGGTAAASCHVARPRSGPTHPPGLPVYAPPAACAAPRRAEPSNRHGRRAACPGRRAPRAVLVQPGPLQLGIEAGLAACWRSRQRPPARAPPRTARRAGRPAEAGSAGGTDTRRSMRSSKGPRACPRSALTLVRRAAAGPRGVAGASRRGTGSWRPPVGSAPGTPPGARRPGDGHPARLQRLAAASSSSLAAEFRQFVEKQHAVVRPG